EQLAGRAQSAHGWALAIVAGGLAGYIAYKFISRRRFLRELRTARIGADELKARIDSGEALVIVDLRHPLDVEAEPETIPGAFRMDAEKLQQKPDWLSLDREVI